MKKIKTPLKDLYIFQGKKFSDSRGFLREVFHKKQIKKNLIFSIVSKSKKNTLRGLHLQKEKTQDKFITVLKGEILDVVVDLTETGRALKAVGLKIIDTIITSHTELVANRDSAENPELRHAMNQIHTLLEGTLEARGKVLVKMNVGTSNLEGVLEAIPSMKAPTVNELAKGEGYAVETVVAKSEINVLIPELRDKGASDIIELPLSKIVH